MPAAAASPAMAPGRISLPAPVNAATGGRVEVVMVPLTAGVTLAEGVATAA
jgi:hypothetical protein